MKARCFWALLGCVLGWALAIGLVKIRTSAGEGETAPTYRAVSVQEAEIEILHEATSEKISVNGIPLEPQDIENITPAYIDSLDFTVFSNSLELSDSAIDVLGLSVDDTKQVNLLISQLSDEIEQIEFANMEVTERSTDRLSVVVKAFRAEGEQLLRNTEARVLAMLGEGKGRILTEKSRDAIKDRLRDIGYFEQRFVFLPNSNNGYSAKRYTDTGWEELFPGTTSLPEKYRHLFVWAEDEHASEP